MLGAYADVTNAKTALDIGTGTGLLALMLAQRNPALRIDAVEIERGAFEQATQNAAQSPFSSQIRVVHASIQAFSVQAQQPYDLVITNPPFFVNHPKRREASQNLALHSEALQLPELAILASHLLKKEGKFIVLLPIYEMTLLEEAAEEVKLFPVEKLRILEKENGREIRVITTFGFANQPCREEVLPIRNQQGTYTPEFIALLKPYYL